MFCKACGNDVFFAFNDIDYENIDDYHKIKYSHSWTTDKHIAEFAHFVHDRDIDIIVSQNLATKNIVASIKNLQATTSVKTVFCIHTTPLYCYNKPQSLRHRFRRAVWLLLFRRDIDQTLIRKSYLLYDKFVLLSPNFYDEFLSHFHLERKEKLCYIHNPLSFQETISHEEIERKKKQVLILSRFEEAPKNLRAAFRVWKSIEKVGYNGWELVVGGYGQDEQMLLQYVKDIEMTHYQWIGKVENPIPLYKESAIFMVTSDYEGFCMTLIESLQMGVVPIAFGTFASVFDIIQDGCNGFVIPAKREDLYANKLRMLMSNQLVRQEMMKNAIASSERFSIEKIGEQWMDLFNGILKK